MAERQQEADNVLNLIKEKRSVRACYPCARRKIRCSGGQPCETCLRRNHPDICFYKQIGKRKREDDVIGRNEQRAVSNVTARQQPSPLPQRAQNVGDEQRSQAKRTQHVTKHSDDTTLGNHSMASYLRDRLDDARSSLGLVNHSATKTALPEIAGNRPSRSEVFRFFPSFRANIVPFTEMIPDVDAFELAMLNDLDGLEAAEADGNGVASGFAASRRNRIATYLAALALGAQMSESSMLERSRYADDLGIAERSFTGSALC
jgi:hypothetical protein